MASTAPLLFDYGVLAVMVSEDVDISLCPLKPAASFSSG
jgi:hypothetical protein